MHATLSPVTTASYEADITQFGGVTVLDVWAPWCAPCRALAPILATLAAAYDAEFGDAVQVRTLNADEEAGLAQRLGVRALPTILILRSGQIVDRIAGLPGGTALDARVRQHVAVHAESAAQAA